MPPFLRPPLASRVLRSVVPFFLFVSLMPAVHARLRNPRIVEPMFPDLHSLLLVEALLAWTFVMLTLLAVGAYRRWWMALAAAVVALQLSYALSGVWKELYRLVLLPIGSQGVLIPSVEVQGLLLHGGVVVLLLAAVLLPPMQCLRVEPRGVVFPWPGIGSRFRRLLLAAYVLLLPWLYFGLAEWLKGVVLSLKSFDRLPVWLPEYFLRTDAPIYVLLPLLAIPLGSLAGRASLFAYLLPFSLALTGGMLLTLQWSNVFPLAPWLETDPLIATVCGYMGFLVGAGLVRRFRSTESRASAHEEAPKRMQARPGGADDALPVGTPDEKEGAAGLVECPRCHYVRRDCDQAPTYECPRCGVVYAKYLAAQRVLKPKAEVETPAPPFPWRPGLVGLAAVVLASLASGGPLLFLADRVAQQEKEIVEKQQRMERLKAEAEDRRIKAFREAILATLEAERQVATDPFKGSRANLRTLHRRFYPDYGWLMSVGEDREAFRRREVIREITEGLVVEDCLDEPRRQLVRAMAADIAAIEMFDETEDRRRYNAEQEAALRLRQAAVAMGEACIRSHDTVEMKPHMARIRRINPGAAMERELW